MPPPNNPYVRPSTKELVLNYESDETEDLKTSQLQRFVLLQQFELQKKFKLKKERIELRKQKTEFTEKETQTDPDLTQLYDLLN